MRKRIVFVAAGIGLAAARWTAGGVGDVAHPFLLWTRHDLAAMRERIEKEPWARAEYERPPAPRELGQDLRNLFRYAVMNDRAAGDAEKKKLLADVASPHPLGAALEFRILAYDLLYDELPAEQRAAVETKFREYVCYAIKPGGANDTNLFNNAVNYARYDGKGGRYTRVNWLPNIIFPWKLSANLIAAVLRDERLIRETWATHGSIQWYLDEYLSDLGFYHEEFSKMGSTPGALLMYCTAVRHLGLDELGFGYRGRQGASVRGHIESVLHRTFPGVDTGTGRWRFETMSAGDVRPWQPFAMATVEGYFPNGEGGNALWAAPGAWGGTQRGRHAQWDGYSNFTPKMALRLWFEWGHRLWPDAGFDWFLTRMRAPDQDPYLPTLYFGLDPLDPKTARPPPMRSGIYPQRGFVMLRAEEGTNHWTSPAPAAGLRLTTPYAHSVNDALALCGFYAFNRPIYQNPKSDPGYAFGFSRSVRSHASVMVDGHSARQDWGRTGSAEPAFTDDCTTRVAFSPEVKFVAARTLKRYPGVDETRALMLTREYLFDLSAARSDAGHSYVWLVHTFGAAEPDGGPDAWRPSLALTNLVRELSDVRTLDTAGRDWTVTVRQVRPRQSPAKSRLGDAWWNRPIGVRVHMFGQDGAQAHVGATPRPRAPDGKEPPPAEVEGVTVAASVWAPSATFVALHAPFEGRPVVGSFERIAATNDAVVARVRGVEAGRLDDRVMVRFGDRADQPVTLAGGGERFTFSDHAYVRIADGKVHARGDLRAIALRVGDARPALTLNGQPAAVSVTDGLLTWER